MDDDWEPRIWEESPGFSIWSLDDASMEHILAVIRRAVVLVPATPSPKVHP